MFTTPSNRARLLSLPINRSCAAAAMPRFSRASGCYWADVSGLQPFRLHPDRDFHSFAGKHRVGEPLRSARTLLAYQLLFRCSEFLEFSLIHLGMRQID